jgi:hypothetical protein
MNMTVAKLKKLLEHVKDEVDVTIEHNGTIHSCVTDGLKFNRDESGLILVIRTTGEYKENGWYGR